MTTTHLELFYIDIVSNYIRDKTSFLNLMCVSKKFKKINKKYNSKMLSINSPFVDDKLFPENKGPNINKWYHLYIIDGNVSRHKPIGLYNVYVHSLKYKPAFRSHYNSIVELNLQSLNKEIFEFHSFYCLPALTKLILPKRLTRIEGKFQSCERLKEIIISNDTEIIKNSFTTSSMLSTITTHDYMFEEIKPNILPKNVLKIEHSFSFCKDLKTIVFNEGIKELIESFNCCGFEGDIILPKSLDIINKSFERFGDKNYRVILKKVPSQLNHYVFE